MQASKVKAEYLQLIVISGRAKRRGRILSRTLRPVRAAAGHVPRQPGGGVVA